MNSALLIKPSSLGDVIHTLPALEHLRESFPTARLEWLINTEWAPLLENHPALDGLRIFPRQDFRDSQRWPSALSDMVRLRRQPRFEVGIDFQGLFRSAALGRWSGARQMVGFANGREGASCFYDQSVALPEPPAPPLHSMERYLTLARHLSGRTETEPPPCRLPSGEAPAQAPEPGFLLLHPFSKGQGKSLSHQFIKGFLEEWSGPPVVLAGRVSGPIPDFEHCLNLLNQTTLPGLIWLLHHAAMVVSVDSGPMHLAAAMNKPLLGIHSWSDPRSVGPYSKQAWVWKSGRTCLFHSLDETWAAPGPLPSPEEIPMFIEQIVKGPANSSVGPSSQAPAAAVPLEAPPRWNTTPPSAQ